MMYIIKCILLVCACFFADCGGGYAAPTIEEIKNSPLARALEQGKSSVAPGDHLAQAERMQSIIERFPREDPYMGQALFYLAQNLEQAGKWERAVSFYDQSMKHPVYDAGLHVFAAQGRLSCLYSLGRWKEVVDKAQSLCALPRGGRYDSFIDGAVRNRNRALVNIALKTRKDSDIKAAGKAFEEVRTRTSQMRETNGERDLFIEALFEEFDMLRRLGKRQEAVALINKFLYDHAKDKDAAILAYRVELCQLGLEAGPAPSKSIIWISKKYPCNTKTGINVLELIGSSLHCENRYKESIEYYNLAMKYRGGAATPSSLSMMLTAHYFMGNKDQAKALAQRLFEEFPDSSQAKGVAEQFKKWNLKMHDATRDYAWSYWLVPAMLIAVGICVGVLRRKSRYIGGSAMVGLLLGAFGLSGCNSGTPVSCVDEETGQVLPCALTNSSPVEIALPIDNAFIEHGKRILVTVPQTVISMKSNPKLASSCGCVLSEIEARGKDTAIHIAYTPKKNPGSSRRMQDLEDNQEISVLGVNQEKLAVIKISSRPKMPISLTPWGVELKAGSSSTVEVKHNYPGAELKVVSYTPVWLKCTHVINNQTKDYKLSLSAAAGSIGHVQDYIHYTTSDGEPLLFPVALNIKGSMEAETESFRMESDNPLLYTVNIRMHEEVPLEMLEIRADPSYAPVKISSLGPKRIQLAIRTDKILNKGLIKGVACLHSKVTRETLYVPYEIFK